MLMEERAAAIGDEELIAALLATGTIEGAAKELSLSVKTVRMCLDNRVFREAFNKSKADLMRIAAYSLIGKLSAAIDTVSEIMTDKEIDAAVRLQAAQTIINGASRLVEQQQKNGQTGNSKYSFSTNW